jgi:8-amino-7-oxononanoate synthase
MQTELDELKRRGLYRAIQTVSSTAGRTVRIQDREKIVFCSNNYLGLANHPKIIESVQIGLATWGFGAGASQLISGHTEIHERLEDRLAALFHKEAALIFPSGYQANISVLGALAGKGDLIVMDKLVHASLIDGARGSGAAVRTYPHKQTDKLKRLLDEGKYDKAIIVSDSLFSMDGDFANLEELVEIKNKYGVLLLVDEAHAFGCVGPDGLGWAAESGVLDEVDITIITFSKALGGVGGGVVCSRTVADYLINRARGYIYSTAIPAVHCLAVETALDLEAAEPERRKQLWKNSEYLRKRLQENNFDVGLCRSYIIPILSGSAEKVVAISQQLFAQGLWVPGIRPPTVPPGASRLRISVTSEHTQEDLEQLIRGLQQIHYEPI